MKKHRDYEQEAAELAERYAALGLKEEELYRYLVGALYSTHSWFPTKPQDHYRVLTLALDAMERDGKFNGDTTDTAMRISRDASL